MHIEIPESVTSIGYYAFDGTAWFNNHPNGLVYAGFVAYQYKGEMPNASSISLLEGTVGIAENAFKGCTALLSIEIPNSVSHIGTNAFQGCSSITSIEIPNSVTSIGSEAFADCTSLRNVSISNSITSIGDNNAFDNCNITTLILLGEGEWRGGAIGINNKYSFYKLVLYVDSRITSLKGINIKPSGGVYCYAQTPPTCDENTFNDYSGELHIPANSLASYFTSEYWSNFDNIIGDAVEIDGMNISQSYVEVNIGTQFNLTATLSPANATPNGITWRSTNTSIATVSYDGIVTAVSVGECDIIAQCLHKKAICHVVVKDTNVIITLEEQETNLLPNHIITLTPSASPVMPDGFAVTSSDPTVAAARVVNNKIQVMGIKEGTTLISVGSTDGNAIPATCLVTVYTEPGDLDCDGFRNISDVTSLIDYLLSDNSSQISSKNADVDGDQCINISDVTTLIDILLQSN